MNLDRDLRDALRPLAADPISDAARVLGALPAATGSPRGTRAPEPERRWLPWTTLAAGLLIGALSGTWLAGEDERDPLALPRGGPGGAQPGTGNDPVAGLGTGAREPGARTDPAKDPANDPPAGPAKGLRPAEPMRWPETEDERKRFLEIMAFGPIDIDEPLEGRQHIAEGRYYTHVGTQFRTGTSQVGVYAIANDARMRLDEETSARLRPDEIDLESGRMWVHCGENHVTLRVDTGIAKVFVEAGAAMFRRSPSGLEVTALGGRLVVRTEAQTVRLEPRERVFVDAEQGVREREPLRFAGAETSWMTNMILMGADQTEMHERVQRMVAAYEEGEFRDEARREILKLGPRCTWLLAESIERNVARDRDYALAAAELVARIVDYASARYVLPLLMVEDPELRRIVYEGVADATGTDGGTEASFWQDASRERRRTAIESWMRELR